MAKKKRRNKEVKKIASITRICPICGNVYNGRIRCCMQCRKKSINMATKLFPQQSVATGRKPRLSISSVLFIKKKYQLEHKDTWSFIENNPNLFLKTICHSTKQERNDNKREMLIEMGIKVAGDYSSQPVRPEDYYAQLPDIPKLMKKYPKYEFVRLIGKKTDPLFIIRCKKCGKEISTNYNEMKTNGITHFCTGEMSSGERFVKEYIEDCEVEYLTQYDTNLICINPLTNQILPYDFEIPSMKLIIEVQGDQHRKFVPKFHKNLKGFEYQKYKDRVKKEYAISQGYKFMELWYEDLTDEGVKKRYVRYSDTLLNNHNFSLFSYCKISSVMI